MSYYELNKEWFKEYYKVYYLKHRQEQIDKANIWNITHKERHAIACKKYVLANKADVYGKRRVKYLHKILMKQLQKLTTFTT